MIEYYGIFIYILIAIILAQVLFAASFFLVYQNADLEKVSSYECGFNPFQDARLSLMFSFI
jgi:NADH-quinone oxidoreductase subunit A